MNQLRSAASGDVDAVRHLPALAVGSSKSSDHVTLGWPPFTHMAAAGRAAAPGTTGAWDIWVASTACCTAVQSALLKVKLPPGRVTGLTATSALQACGSRLARSA